MSFIKPEDKFKITLASYLGWGLIHILGRLVRMREIGEENYLKLEEKGEKYIFCLWHGRMLIPIFVQRGRDIVAMVSQHVDGEIIARTVEKLGYHTIRGSSTRGGGQALREMVLAMRNGAQGAMMPDGPRGPRCDFKVGTFLLAQMTNAYLVPMTHAAEKAWVFNSWDRFTVAKPFSKVVIAYGEPMKVPRRMTEDETADLKAEMEGRMNTLVERAENYLREEWK